MAVVSFDLQSLKVGVCFEEVSGQSLVFFVGNRTTQPKQNPPIGLSDDYMCF